MSYILDALKKSEKERQRGAVPDLLTMQEVVLHERKSQRVWPYVIALAAVLAIGLSAYLALPVKTKTGAPASNPVAAQKSGPESAETPSSLPGHQAGLPGENEKGDTLVKAVTEKKNTPRFVPPSARKAAKSVPGVTGGPEQKERAAAVVHEEPAVRKEVASGHPAQPAAKSDGQRSAPQVVLAEPKPVHSDPPPVPGRIYRTEELPPSFRQSLPPVNISIFMYSEDPASRMVRINGQTYREGQSLGEGLKLEEIKPDGVVINYRNYRLHIGQKP